mmetsp:Transcript_16569/g.18752  ORF Transcript_16569/g.18752 Transcript_16569/m.18752 type:complete len:209 (-) Transcript_16569:1551-2177(-)
MVVFNRNEDIMNRTKVTRRMSHKHAREEVMLVPFWRIGRPSIRFSEISQEHGTDTRTSKTTHPNDLDRTISACPAFTASIIDQSHPQLNPIPSSTTPITVSGIPKVFPITSAEAKATAHNKATIITETINHQIDLHNVKSFRVPVGRTVKKYNTVVNGRERAHPIFWITVFGGGHTTGPSNCSRLTSGEIINVCATLAPDGDVSWSES